MQLLKQSTAATVPLGPALDSTDGNTTEEALTISQADIRLSKNGGAFAQTNNATGATHDENGWYGIPLDTTDTNTLGRLDVAVHESGALAMWKEFMVVPANVYDALVGDSDVLQVHATEISNDLITAAAIATDAIGATEIAAGAIAADAFAAGAIDATAIATGAIDADAIAANAIGASEIADGAIDAGAFAQGAADKVWDTAARILTASTNFNDISVTDILTTQMTEAYAADTVAPTLAQILFMIWSMASEKAVVTTTVTTKKLDGSTSAMTFTLNNATNPTSITRAT